MRTGALFVFLTALLCGCAFEAEPSVVQTGRVKTEPKPREWTFVVYMAADNNLESAALADLNELESVDLTDTGVQVLVLLDRAADGDATCGNWTDTRLFSVGYDAEKSNELVSERIPCPELGLTTDGETELDMADGKTLSALLAFAGREYPAAHYGLVIWGHGTGWRNAETEPDAEVDGASGAETAANVGSARAFAVDDCSGTYMAISELRASISAGLSRMQDDTQLDVIGFDTCFGICMETAYELRDCAAYLVGTPALVPEGGWNYAALFRDFAAGSRSVEAFTDCALEQYKAQYQHYGYASFSVVDCAQMQAAADSFNAFAREAAAVIQDTDTRNAWRALLETETESYYSGTFPCDFYLDAASMVTQLFQAEPSLAVSAENALLALHRAVPAAWSSREQTDGCGMGVFYAIYKAAGIPESAHPALYQYGSRVTNQSQFVGTCTDYVPTTSCSGSLLDKLFYTHF